MNNRRECKGGDRVLKESLDAAQIAGSMFAGIRSCTLIIAGFAVNVAVMPGMLFSPLI